MTRNCKSQSVLVEGPERKKHDQGGGGEQSRPFIAREGENTMTRKGEALEAIWGKRNHIERHAASTTIPKGRQRRSNRPSEKEA